MASVSTASTTASLTHHAAPMADRLAKGSGQLNSSSEAQPFDMAILAQFMAKR